ncbi:Gfo/Idh/MocA family oxidoreductase [Caldibacillus lycopersici]|uniref:Gfo/Idh/MocA family oxidoreductase n=1 Tax=Perspicuibacillus lycopersici TaxID=1325689 RepID=A0AAE3IZC8_9BACI|nr:Gfo/Idh/MocA family oxidoreductase [Perspicuibacillus lycopersici]MCU9614850.1 Gfo/Idh/MocA family oxidoreductase [Perspicuibacillus lycopersici]
MLKVAVIGLGDISSIHLEAIEENPDAMLVAVCDREEARKNIVPSIPFYTDYLEMLAKEELDCVHICLPHYLHYPVTKACVEHGIHVFQEKPLALNSEEGFKFVKLAEENPMVKICICFQNRFNETFEKLQEITNTNKYGNILHIKGLVTWERPKSYYDEKPWRGKLAYAGGGVMMNQSIHTLDLMQLLGGEISSIRGNIAQLLDYGIETEDTASARIQFANGATGFFFATIANGNNSSVELQVIFEKQKLTIKDSKLTMQNDRGEKIEIEEDAKLSGSKFYYGASHRKLIRKFYRAIIENSEDYVHVIDAFPSIKIIDSIVQSSKLNKEIVLNTKVEK